MGAWTREGLEAHLRGMANAIPEPCGLAQGLSIGMVDMGLICGIELTEAGKSWDVAVRARVTSPDCLHLVYFERELRAAIGTVAEIRQVSVVWEDGSDWTPESMSKALQDQLRERRKKRMREISMA